MRKRKQDLSEVTRMVFVEVDPVVMLTTSVSATSRMLPVLSDPGKIQCQADLRTIIQVFQLRLELAKM